MRSSRAPPVSGARSFNSKAGSKFPRITSDHIFTANLQNPLTVNHWHPYLIGKLVRLRPLVASDFDALFAAASDPLIWEQHPDRERYTRARFQIYFDSALTSDGALIVIEQATGKIVGSSRFCNFSPETSSIEIGYTFITRDCWGKSINREIKELMLHHAFQKVESAYFVVGKDNQRSRRAMLGLGAIQVFSSGATPRDWDFVTSVVYSITHSQWQSQLPQIEQPPLQSTRLDLEPIGVEHAQAMWDLFNDPELHHFVPFEPQSLERQQTRCENWARRRSKTGQDVWYNWAGRERASGKVVAHFQVTVPSNGTATLGYLVARSHQKQGLALEGLHAVIAYLTQNTDVQVVRALADTRNQASHALAKKLGMDLVDTIKDADYFKGATSDEFVFAKSLRN